MTAAPSAEQISSTAQWLAQATDPAGQALRLVHMTNEAYRAASFLDDRLFQAPVVAHSLPFDEVAAAFAATARSDARWIFHIGHVGSTLISRLLGEFDGILSIREPRLLRDLAAMPPDRRKQLTPTVQKLFSRTLDGESALALVKATSFVGQIAAELVPAGERALFVYAAPRSYVSGILAGDNSREELRVLAPSRAARMAGRVPSLAPRTPAELAATAWACEMTALEAAAEVIGEDHLLWVDFDAFLQDVPAALARLATFVGTAAPVAHIEQVARGPLLSRYSKALEHDYSPSLRRELIEQEYRLQRPQIDAALAMLDRSAQDSPLLARALARVRGER